MNDRLREAIANRQLGPTLREIGWEDKVLTSFKAYGALLLEDGRTTPPEILRQFGN